MIGTSERFWSKVDKSDPSGCWIWVSALSRRGYGSFWHQGRSVQSHRLAYELSVGPIPKNMHVHHTCNVPRCVRPDHLRVVTNRENVLVGAGITAKNARADHCIHGHPFDAANTYLRPGARPGRECRACSRESYRRCKSR